MSEVKSNFIFNAIYQILILIIPFITTPYVARTIGAEGVGIYSYTYSIVSYFMMFALLGMNNYGNREVAKVKDDKNKLNITFSSIYYLQLLITIIVSIVYLIYIKYIDNEYRNIEMIQIIYVISVAFDVNWLLCGLQKFKVTVSRSIVIKITTLVLILVFVKNESDLNKYIFILAMMTLLNQMILWIFLRKEVKFVKVNKREIFKHLKPTIILFVPILALSVYKTMDKIMIGQMADVTQVGYYENAEKMLNIILSVVGALGTVTLPQMTYLYSQNKQQELEQIFKKSINFIFFLVFPAIFGFMATSDSLVYIYLGEEFKNSAILLKILSISLLFSSIASIIRMQLLIPRNKDKEYIISIIAGAIVNFILNIILINLHGAMGAAIGTVIAEVIVCIFHCFFIRKEIQVKYYLTKSVNFLIKSLIMFIIVYIIGDLIDNIIWRLIIQVLVGIIIYSLLNIEYIKTQIITLKIRK